MGFQNRETRRAAIAVGAVFFVNGAVFANWVARIPAVKDDLGASSGALGLALLGIAVGSLVTMPFAGRWCERWESRWVVTVSMVTLTGAVTTLAHAPSVAALAALLTAFGASFGVMDVAMNVQAVAIVRRTGRPVMPWFHAGFSLGGLVGAGTGGLAAAAGVTPNWHFVMVAAAVVGALLAVRGHLLPDPANGADAEPATDPANGDGIEPATAAASEGASTNPAGRRGVPVAVIVGLGAVAMCATVTEGAMADWTTLFLRDVRGLGAGAATAGFAAFSVTMTAGRLGGEAAIRRFGSASVLRFGGLASSTGILLATAIPHAVAGIVGFALVGVGMCCVFPLALTTAGEAGAGSGSREIAQVSVIGYVGFLAGPPTIGLLAEVIGLGGALAVLLLPGVALALLAPLVGRVGADDVEAVRRPAEPAAVCA